MSKSQISHLNSSSNLIEFQKISQIPLFICGFDPYSPLYSLIRDYFIKLVSLVLILTQIGVYSTIALIQFVIGLLKIHEDKIQKRSVKRAKKTRLSQALGKLKKNKRRAQEEEVKLKNMA